ncbi:MAG: LysR family transcriptional regulator [Roseibium album]|uniref:Gcv operon activator n=1 Tax=Roseibium album TaxID=311410 RepID=A0A0M6ZHG7_9HYPH|nr:LysR family transcriptional regulator [Roseibium album]MBG6155781.1 LysR family glycine cleavage system transcriptional activator [Labrenzia sp. EL_162]MBG6161234.1 LysR family glycine cleavage system transcriptional activator [Labrenzia sp. EL_195]MBG6177236.1 LysR family glycine cleavage system transcriptional activator [Labrenzia sp. EL_132]MBG6194315.1 LysR family glycine cleavage system transcriptional activator [Labrenzia sp. EL_159]MBG6205639.1 LysR family glycine cleavage system tra
MDKSRFENLPLEWVRAFEVAARTGSFTAAAQETGLTQSAISQRIGKLEKRLETQLFLRQPRSISLTVEGETWVPHVRSALESLRESSEGIFGISRNRVTISASASIIELWLMPRLYRLSSEIDAQISFKTLVLSSEVQQEPGVIQIRYGSGDWPYTYKLPLYSEVIAPVASPKLLGRSADWTGLPRIAVVGPRPGWNDWSARFGTPSTPLADLRFDTFFAALSAARKGFGVTLASLPLCQEDLKTGRLQRVSTENLPHHQTYWLLASKEAVSRKQWNLLEKGLKAIGD